MTPPLEWHPAYRDRTWLLDWLNGEPGYAHWGDVIRLPVVPSVRAALRPDLGLEPPTTPTLRTLAMTRRRAYGLAPYVGREYVYTWWVGIDDLHRTIASDSTITYLAPA